VANETSPQTDVPLTHPKGFMFLFAGEFAERFSFYGMRAILPLYLSDQMGFGEGEGGRYYTFFLAACYLLPLLGGYIADNFFGKYWTIVGFSVPYVAGQFLVGFENQYLLIFSLALLAMGTGVIKPNISTLMGITYDQQRPGQEKLRSNAFQYFYMSINIGAACSQIIVPIVRDQTGSYLIAFIVPAAFMVIALAIFAAGKKYYGTEVINRNRAPSTPEQTVAKMRVLGQVALLFALVSFFWAVFDQSSYTWVFFAKTYMDREILGYTVAPDSIQALNPIFIVMFIGGALVVRNLWPSSGEAKAGMAPTQKMLIGFLLTAVCMGVMAVAGYRTGEPEAALQIKAKEIELFLPLGTANLTEGTVDFKEEKLANKGGDIKFPEGSAKSLKFEKFGSVASDKVTFKDGELTLADGKKVVFTKGRLDFEKSSSELFQPGKMEMAGVLEFTYRQGRYQLPNGILVIKRGNEAELLSGERLKTEPSKATETPSVTVGPGKYVKPENRVSMWWMALAFFVITIAEVLISVTGLELAFVVAPPSMKGFITACWLLTVFVANAFINALIADLYPAMHPGNYFLLLAGAGLVVAALFVPVSRRFRAAMEAQQAASS
jgi:POT family proton-dependent oligopeptide transporter